MTTLPWTAHLTGAYTTPALIGRTAALDQISQALQRTSARPLVIFIAGKGGIGKTRFITQALTHAAQLPTARVAQHLIDLYHVPTHTSLGLALALYSVLTPPDEPFRTYQNARRRLERARLSGELEAMPAHRTATLNAFRDDVARLSAGRRLVLALDTAERLVYGSEHMVLPGNPLADAWTWLIEALPHWPQSVLCVAGRAPIRWLQESLRDHPNIDTLTLTLGPFSADESLAYFEAVAQQAAQQGPDGAAVARRISGLSLDLRRRAHAYTDGQPILLALLIDYLSVSSLGHTPDLLRALSGTPHAGDDPTAPDVPPEAEHRHAQLEELLLIRLRQTPRLGDTLVALGRTPKGLDAPLLAALLDVTPEEAQVRLDELRPLSFVKVRPSDARVFLHDELYAMLQRHLFDAPADAPQTERTGQVIIAYYEAQLQATSDELNALYAPVEAGDREHLDLERLAEAHTRRQILLSEVVYYRLRQDPVRGFHRYYRYTREAALSGDITLDLQLQSELLNFISERDPLGQASVVDGLERDLVIRTTLMRPVISAYTEQKYAQVLAEGIALRAAQPQALAATPRLFEAHLATWEASALTLLGGEENFQMAEARLEDAIHIQEAACAESRVADDDAYDARLWRARAALAFAYRVRGYLKHVRGFMQGAIADYRRAARLWREVDLQVELATTLNDMGFALSDLGQWDDARALVSDALDMRRRLGPRSPVGLSLTTLADIDRREGAYAAAIRRTDTALALFRALENQRGIAFALLGLAESQRRQSQTAEVATADEKVLMLREAREHTHEALRIFEALAEVPRQVQTCIEEGCIARNWIRARRTQPNPRDNLVRIAAEGEHALRRAAALAGEAILYRRVEALIDLAWLGFYTENEALLTEGIAQAAASVPPDYRLDPARGCPTIAYDQAQVLLWPQLGELHLLAGHRAWNTRRPSREPYSAIAAPRSSEADLRSGVAAYTLCLEYHRLYGANNPGLRRAKHEIYERLKRLKYDQLITVAHEVRATETTWHLTPSLMHEFLEWRALWYDE